MDERVASPGLMDVTRTIREKRRLGDCYSLPLCWALILLAYGFSPGPFEQESGATIVPTTGPRGSGIIPVLKSMDEAAIAMLGA